MQTLTIRFLLFFLVICTVLSVSRKSPPPPDAILEIYENGVEKEKK
jgi:hypothetical protein